MNQSTLLITTYRCQSINWMRVIKNVLDFSEDIYDNNINNNINMIIILIIILIGNNINNNINYNVMMFRQTDKCTVNNKLTMSLVLPY